MLSYRACPAPRSLNVFAASPFRVKEIYGHFTYIRNVYRTNNADRRDRWDRACPCSMLADRGVQRIECRPWLVAKLGRTSIVALFPSELPRLMIGLRGVSPPVRPMGRPPPRPPGLSPLIVMPGLPMIPMRGGTSMPVRGGRVMPVRGGRSMRGVSGLESPSARFGVCPGGSLGTSIGMLVGGQMR